MLFAERVGAIDDVGPFLTETNINISASQLLDALLNFIYLFMTFVNPSLNECLVAWPAKSPEGLVNYLTSGGNQRIAKEYEERVVNFLKGIYMLRVVRCA